MSRAGGAGEASAVTGRLPGIAGDYYGRATRRLENAACWLEVITGGGPRIVGFGLRGQPNILTETPATVWDSGYGPYELLGGHRLWVAPESPECSIPDSEGLTVSAAMGGLRLVGAVESPTGLRREMEVHLDRDAAAVAIRHVLTNEGSRTLDLAPWAITQLRLGGVAVVTLPGPATEHFLTPNQILVLWPYATWTDARLSLGDRTLAVIAKPAARFKIGCLSRTGSAGYLRDGLLFVKRFDAAVGAPHADMGTNVQIYCDEGTIELESLGPLVRLAPGDSVTHAERWELRDIGEGADVAAVAALL
jgi:hypothetical protein